MRSGAVVTVVDGNLTMDADRGSSTAASYVGVQVTGPNTTVRSNGAGEINITGRGGSGSSTYGILVDNSIITSSGGSISLTGIAGGTGASTNNIGVLVNGAAQVRGLGNANVLVEGTGGIGGSSHGVMVQTSSVVASTSGALTVEGRGGSGGNSQRGVFVDSSGLISTISGALTVVGTGGLGGRRTWEWRILWGTNSRITSSTGPMSIEGTGGTGTGNLHKGVLIVSSGTVSSTGGATLNIEGDWRERSRFISYWSRDEL